MEISQLCNDVFRRCIDDYHLTDNVDAEIPQNYQTGSFESLLYNKSWIDCVQWHLEDIIRDPDIDPLKALGIKRRIDLYNQKRTDFVEQLDDYFLNLYINVKHDADATKNTESPAWAIDRLSILALKIYHMAIEANRVDAPDEHRNKCATKLYTLNLQQQDLSLSIDQLICDISQGKKKMAVYRQMKMYNDPNLNPVLYKG